MMGQLRVLKVPARKDFRNGETHSSDSMDKHEVVFYTDNHQEYPEAVQEYPIGSTCSLFIPLLAFCASVFLGLAVWNFR
jgi:hypothetical protein